MSDLKPCPFCGSKSVRHERKSKLHGFTGLDIRVERQTYSVRCNVCHARGGTVSGLVAPFERWKDRERLPKEIVFPHELEEKATELWNRRK